MKGWMVALGLCLSATAVADVYRCEINGKTVFSDTKCSSSAQRLDIQPDFVDSANGEELRRQTERIHQDVEASRKARPSASSPNPRIAALEAELAELEQQREAELATLRKRLQRKDNSHVDRRRLEAAIRRVNERYDAQQQERQEEISNLRARQ